jgi:hypothetical protein
MHALEVIFKKPRYSVKVGLNMIIKFNAISSLSPLSRIILMKVVTALFVKDIPDVYGLQRSIPLYSKQTPN